MHTYNLLFFHVCLVRQGRVPLVDHLLHKLTATCLLMQFSTKCEKNNTVIRWHEFAGKRCCKLTENLLLISVTINLPHINLLMSSVNSAELRYFNIKLFLTRKRINNANNMLSEPLSMPPHKPILVDWHESNQAANVLLWAGLCCQTASPQKAFQC